MDRPGTTSLGLYISALSRNYLHSACARGLRVTRVRGRCELLLNPRLFSSHTYIYTLRLVGSREKVLVRRSFIIARLNFSRDHPPSFFSLFSSLSSPSSASDILAQPAAAPCALIKISLWVGVNPRAHASIFRSFPECETDTERNEIITR